MTSYLNAANKGSANQLSDCFFLKVPPLSKRCLRALSQTDVSALDLCRGHVWVLAVQRGAGAGGHQNPPLGSVNVPSGRSSIIVDGGVQSAALRQAATGHV